MEKFYVATPIYYPNANLHMGHAYTTALADFLARYHRLQGADVYFVTGTDDHATKVAKEAHVAGIDPREFVIQKGENFKKFFKLINASNDGFLQTSDQETHWPGVQKIWKAIDANGDLYKKTYSGLYCVGCEEFKKEEDLVDGKCSLHDQKPEHIEEENYFFKLSNYGDVLKEKIESGELKIVPESRKNEILSLINRGLEDVSFSRPKKSVDWGIPVPGDETQTIYVWCDALSYYASTLGYGTDDESAFEKYWPVNAHVIGKDILRFHAAIWPAMQLSAGLPLSKSILAHGFITSQGKKMSKTIGNVVDPVELIEKYGADALRYWLARINPYEDGDFTYEHFESLYNADLANNLGNLVSRTSKLIDTKLEGQLLYKEQFMSQTMLNEIDKTKKVYHEKIADFKLHEALSDVWALLSFANSYIDEHKPWDKEASPEDILKTLTSISRLIIETATLLEPFLPETADKIRQALSAPQTIDSWENTKLISIETKPLFPRLEK